MILSNNNKSTKHLQLVSNLIFFHDVINVYLAIEGKKKQGYFWITYYWEFSQKNIKLVIKWDSKNEDQPFPLEKLEKKWFSRLKYPTKWAMFHF
jgi:hypothetical protein